MVEALMKSYLIKAKLQRQRVKREAEKRTKEAANLLKKRNRAQEKEGESCRNNIIIFI